MLSFLKRPPVNLESSKYLLCSDDEMNTFFISLSGGDIVSRAKFRYVSVDGLPHLIDLNVVQLEDIASSKIIRRLWNFIKQYGMSKCLDDFFVDVKNVGYNFTILFLDFINSLAF